MRGFLVANLLLASWSLASLPALARPFIIAGSNDIPPPFEIAEGAEANAGILVEIYRECLRRLNIEVRYEIYPWARVRARVESGEADAMTNVADEQTLGYAVATRETIVHERLVAFASRLNPNFDSIMKARSIAELSTLRLLDIVGSHWPPQSAMATPILYATDRADLLSMLAFDRGDFVVEQDEATKAELEALRRDPAKSAIGDIIGSSHPLITLEYRLMVSQRSAYLDRLADLDRTLAAMRKDGTIRAAYRKYGVADEP